MLEQTNIKSTNLKIINKEPFEIAHNDPKWMTFGYS